MQIPAIWYRGLQAQAILCEMPIEAVDQRLRLGLSQGQGRGIGQEKEILVGLKMNWVGPQPIALAGVFPSPKRDRAAKA